MKNNLIIIALLIVAQSVSAQVAVSYFPFQSTFSVASNTEFLVWADCKLETNTAYTNLSMEFSPKVNFRRGEIANYYVGAGVNFDPTFAYNETPFTNGFFADLGTRIKPFAKARNIQLVLELSPYVNKAWSGGNLRSRLGLAWNFARSKDKADQKK